MTADPTPRGDHALFLDFDGTLVDIAPRPDAVVVEPRLRDALAVLRDRLDGALAIVTGRTIAVVDGFLDLPGLDVAGLHGIEFRVGGAVHPCRPEDHPALRRGIDELRARFRDSPGVLIEDKGCSVGVHWRLAPDAAEAARSAVEALRGALGDGYRIQAGKAVAEILPARSGKGPAIERLMEAPPYAGRRPVFIGDDLTDEGGFRAVNALGGLSVRVGPGETCATHRAAAPADVREALIRWAETGAPGFSAAGA
jgi:trehalose 6-phosphate phosphatase